MMSGPIRDVTVAPVRYQRSPHLVAYWRGSHPYVRNYATRLNTRATSLVFELLAAAADWATRDELAGLMQMTNPSPETLASFQTLLDKLVEASVLRRSDTPPPPADVAMDEWGDWNPAAGFFHGATKDIVFLEDDGNPFVRPDDGPSGAEGRGGAVGVSTGLPRPRRPGAIGTILQRRRTWRRFAKRPLQVEDLGSLLWWTAGVHGWLLTPQGEKLPLKSSPSAGARHPIDLHVLVRNVGGVAPGLYRYDPERHRLEAGGRAAAADIRTYLPRQYWYTDAGVVVFLCARFERTRQRYQFPRAYRAIAAEAGHVCQTFCLVATALGLAPFSTMALAEDAIDRDLGLDGVRESVIYAAGVGVPFRRGTPSAPLDVGGARILPHRIPARKTRAGHQHPPDED